MTDKSERRERWLEFRTDGYSHIHESQAAAMRNIGTNWDMEGEIDNSKDELVHVIEYTALEAMREENVKLKAENWVRKDAALRTYDGLAQKADKADELEKEVAALRAQISHLQGEDQA